jgi:hypothetical protein
MGWPDTGSFKEFAEMLMGICIRINKKGNGIRAIYDNLLKQALGDGPEGD